MGAQPWSLVAGPCGSSCSPRMPSRALHISTAFRCFGSALSPVHLPPASCCLRLPSATCAQRSPNFHPAPSQSFPARGRDLVPGHAVPGFLPVLGSSSRAREDWVRECSHGHPGRQAPLNAAASAGAISMSALGDAAAVTDELGQTPNRWRLWRGDITQPQCPKQPGHQRLHPSQGSRLPLAKDSPWIGEGGKMGETPPALL